MAANDSASRVLGLVLMISALVLGGCGGNGYKSFFESAGGQPLPALTQYDDFNLVAFTGTPRIEYKELDEQLYVSLIEDGYAPLGFSSFEGARESESELTSFAKSIGAELVIAESNYSHTVSGSTPVTTYNPYSSSSYGTVNTYGRYGSSHGSYSGYTSGSYTQTQMIPYSVARYDQKASFWTRRPRPPVFGAMYENPSREDRQRLGVNGGVRVVACVRGSPAWNANFVPSDFIVAMNGTPVDSAEHLMRLQEQHAGTECMFTVVRGNQKNNVRVRLNPDPRITK